MDPRIDTAWTGGEPAVSDPSNNDAAAREQTPGGHDSTKGLSSATTDSPSSNNGADSPAGDSGHHRPAAPAPAPARPTRLDPIAAALSEAQSADVDADLDSAMRDVAREAVSGAGAEQIQDDLAEGTIVSGRIANIGSEDILLDFGGKALGVLALGELRRPDEFKVGDQVDVSVMGEDKRTGLVRVSARQARQQMLMSQVKVGMLVEGVVTGMNKGGLDLDIDGVRAFIPSSQVDLHFMKDISELIGQSIRAEVIKFDVQMGDLVVSRRKALQQEQEQNKDKLFAELEVGQVVRGKVRGLAEYGAFIDLGGIDGLLHIGEMSWGRVAKAEDIMQVGDEIDVKILKLNPDTKKISLGLKQIKTNPWETAGERYVVGETAKGRVVRMTNFGAFVELESGIDGLLPLGELSWTRRVRHPSEVVKEGDVVDVGIVGVDAEKQRITLSLKQLRQDPWVTAKEKYTPGSKVQGRVARLTEFGAFVELEEGLDGLIHISELSDKRVRAVGDVVQAGQVVEVRVLSVDAEAKRVSLSMKPPPSEAPEAPVSSSSMAAAKKKSPSKPRRGGLTLDWQGQGLGQLDPSKFR